MQTTSNESPQKAAGLGSIAILGTPAFQEFKEWCINQKLRPRTKQTINTTTWEIRDLFTIEIRISARKWLPLRMPDKSWCWNTNDERDQILNELKPIKK